MLTKFIIFAIGNNQYLTRQRDSTQKVISILEKTSEYYEKMLNNASEKLAQNSWYKEFYENGTLKIDSGTATEKTSQKAAEQTNIQTENYKEKYLNLLSDSEKEHSALISYSYENDSLQQVIMAKESVINNLSTTEKNGLSWFQKTQIAGFWVMVTVLGIVYFLRYLKKTGLGIRF